MGTHEVRQRIEGLRRVNRARGVAGVAQQDGLGLFVDFGGEFGNRRQGKPLLKVRRDRHHLHPCHLRKTIVIRVEWLRNDDLVSGVEA